MTTDRELARALLTAIGDRPELLTDAAHVYAILTDPKHNPRHCHLCKAARKAKR